MTDDPSAATPTLARAVANIPVVVDTDAPLTSQERLAATRLAGRIHSDLRMVLRSLPASSQSASGLARTLGIERTVCQRMVSALQPHDAEASLLARLPGVRSLRAILGGTATISASPDAVRTARGTVDLLGQFFERAGGSQAAFARRLAHSASPRNAGAGVDPCATAAALNRAARQVVGRWSELQLQIAVYRPDPNAPGMMQTGRMRGFLGHHAHDDALPLVVLNRKLAVSGRPSGRGEFESLDAAAAASDPPFAATPFCTSPLGRISVRRDSGSMIQVVDPPDLEQAEGYDFVTADRSISSVPMPTIENPPIHEVWTAIDYPADSLIFDVWQHRDLARVCIPSLSAHLYRINVFETMNERWYTRLPGGPRLELLGTGLDNADSPLWGRHAEALSWMFERLGWDSRDFVGYRCQIRNPLWRIGYLMSFDFGPSQSPAQP